MKAVVLHEYGGPEKLIFEDNVPEPQIGGGTVLIQAAAGDQFTRGAQELAERARRYGVPAIVELYPVNSHDFQSFWSFLPEATDALRQAGQFIRDCGGAAASTTPDR